MREKLGLRKGLRGSSPLPSAMRGKIDLKLSMQKKQHTKKVHTEEITDEAQHHNKVVVLGEVKQEISQAPIVENISWHAPEYEYSPKSDLWYWVSAVVALALIALALWQKNFLFAIFVIIAELVIFSVADKHPKMWEFSIDDKGIYIGKNKAYFYNELEAFDIHWGDENSYDQLVLKTKKKFTPVVAINIYKEDKEKIREVLKKYIKHEEIEISLSDVLGRLIGF